MIHLSFASVLVLVFSKGTVIAACTATCSSCDEFDKCTSCKTGNWGIDAGCQFKCNENCLNRECNAKNGHCNECNIGLYGPTCQQNCNLCEDGQCDLRVCTRGCKAGYYEYKTSDETLCWSCSPDCSSCITNTVCNVCNDGFYLYKYEISGRIFVQCLQCQQGTDCLSACAIQDCSQCQILNNSLICTECRDKYRFNGDICVPNENNCAEGCFTDCDENEMCLGSCNVGFTGERCSDSCANECLKCHKSNANICEECKNDSYTVSCDADCSSSCLTITGKQTCRINDGFCLNGCENQFWGQLCNRSCSNGCADDGVSRVCDRHNGTCKRGCTDGYSGDKCESIVTSERPWITTAETSRDEKGLHTTVNVTTTTSTASHSETSLDCQTEVNSAKDTYFVIGYVSGFGTAVFIVAVTAVLYHLRRRYVSKKPKTSDDCTVTTDTGMSTYYNETSAQTPASERTDNDASNYESLGNSRNTDTVYSELETSEAKQSHKYYNIDFPTRQ